MEYKRYILIVIGAVFLLSVGCCIGVLISHLNFQADPAISLKNAGKQLVDLPELEKKLYQEFPSQEINIQVSNGHILDVGLINSGYLNLPDENSRQKKAKEIAVFITGNYASVETIDTIYITFIERISFGIKLDKSASYEFYVNDLQQ